MYGFIKSFITSFVSWSVNAALRTNLNRGMWHEHKAVTYLRKFIGDSHSIKWKLQGSFFQILYPKRASLLLEIGTACK